MKPQDEQGTISGMSILLNNLDSFDCKLTSLRKPTPPPPFLKGSHDWKACEAAGTAGYRYSSYAVRALRCLSILLLSLALFGVQAFSKLQLIAGNSRSLLRKTSQKKKEKTTVGPCLRHMPVENHGMACPCQQPGPLTRNQGHYE